MNHIFTKKENPDNKVVTAPVTEDPRPAQEERPAAGGDRELTELVFILDRSGSMSGLEGDTIGGFNSMLSRQREEPGRALVSTILFDSESLVLHDRIPLERVPEMTRRDYTVRGCTALLDAIGGAIHHIGNIHKYARPEDVPGHTLFIITTDGMENASRRYDSREVKEMIRRQKEKYGWEFLFLGANIDAVETAANFGIDRQNAVDYRPDSRGTCAVYNAVSTAVSGMRRKGKVEAEWCAEVREDYEARK